jgi:hypothetical protein
MIISAIITSTNENPFEFLSIIVIIPLRTGFAHFRQSFTDQFLVAQNRRATKRRCDKQSPGRTSTSRFDIAPFVTHDDL